MGDTGARHAADARPVGAPDARVVLDGVSALRAQGLVVAPHVLARLHARIGTADELVRHVVGALTESQRQGLRALPVPLPVPSSALGVDGSSALSDGERDALIVLALGTTDRLDVVLATTGLSAEDLSTGAVGGYLDVNAGRVTLREPALADWLEGSASPAESASAHRRLSEYHAQEGDAVRAAWHVARGATAKTPAVAEQLLPAARGLAEAGQSLIAFHIAVEVFDHVDGEDADEARQIAGNAALCAGLLADAVAWLGTLFPGGSPAYRSRALAPLVIAETALRGTLPIADAAALRPDDAEGRYAWHGWARAAGMAAMLSAERGADGAMRMWLSEVRDADVRAGADGAIRGPAVALCWLLSGDEADPPLEQGPLSYGVVTAVRLALAGDIDQGLGILARHEAGIVDEPDAFLQGFERTPLASAYRAVIEVLLRFWQGDIATARSRMQEAMVSHPIGLPFAGLGAVLARRLDLAVLGEVGPVVRSLTEALPNGIRPDLLVDRALQAYLAGAVQDAGVQLRIWHDRGGPSPALAVPGLEELGPHIASDAVEPADQKLSLELYLRIRTAAQGAWQREYPDIAERARSVRSPFERGRVEALLGTTCVIRDDRAAGRHHLLAAHSLFSDAGADAWRDSVERKLAKLGEQIERLAGLDTVPINVSVLDPMAACRAAWAPLLTERELQVAMLVVDGIPNREIADRLSLSVRTVEVHVGRVFAKLDTRSRVELTVLAHRTNLHV
ncbi:LuxR C-terminal-related transcriptional regulator [Microbacterium sp. NPDC056234]|uniref:LuxR C-terminal-related transcriptional regulator n=1 Tax=Microbacterium sp. NPDC056234 TaxID=3345757 RepID=UPI0035DB84BF